MDGERRYLKIFDRFGRAIRLTNERWTHIISHHPVIIKREDEGDLKRRLCGGVFMTPLCLFITDILRMCLAESI